MERKGRKKGSKGKEEKRDIRVEFLIEFVCVFNV